jgi:3-oxoacyl-[acyl-carrier-protein] synthase II
VHVASKAKEVEEVCAGVCDFDALKYQNKKAARRGTRAGSISVYCANEAVNDAKIDCASEDSSRIGVYIGTTEHGNVETENEIYNISKYGYDTQFWSLIITPERFQITRQARLPLI